MRAALEDAPKIGESLCDACREHFDAGAARTSISTACRTCSTRRSCAGSTTTRARRSSSSRRSRTRTRRSAAAAATTASSRRSAVRRRPASASAPGSSGCCSRSSSRASRSSTPTIDVFFVVEEAAPRERVLQALAELRRAGVSADTDYAGRSFKGQMTQAGRTRCAHGRDRPRRRKPRSGATARDEQAGRARRARRYAHGDELARPLLRRTPERPHRQAADRRRLGRHAPRPRRPRLHRPARPHRQAAARRQPGARCRGGGRRARAPQRVRAAGRGRGRRPRARGGQPEPPDRRGRDPGRHAARSSRARRRCRSSSTRRTSTRRCASATAGSTCAATRMQHNFRVSAHGDRRRSAARWTSSASSTSGRRA